MHSPRESETQRHQDLTPLRASSSKHSLSCPDGKGQPLIPSGLLCMEAIYFGFEERTKLWLQSSLAWHQLATESSAVLRQVSHDGQVLSDWAAPRSDLELETTSATRLPRDCWESHLWWGALQLPLTCWWLGPAARWPPRLSKQSYPHSYEDLFKLSPSQSQEIYSVLSPPVRFFFFINYCKKERAEYRKLSKWRATPEIPALYHPEKMSEVLSLLVSS